MADTSPAVQAEQSLVIGPVPLTPIQQWLFEQELPDPHHWNQAMLLEVRHALDVAVLDKVVQHLLVHHDMLRARFERKDSGWQQDAIASEEVQPVDRVDLSGLAAAQQTAAMEAAAAERQANLNLAGGPLVRVAFFDLGSTKPGRLLLVIHHLVVDGVSWRILLEDLQLAYRQLTSGEESSLPPKTTAFKQWAEQLTAYAQSVELRQELPYWLAEQQTQVFRLPVEYPGGANTVASACTVSVSLSVEETRALLQDVPSAYQTQINEVLMTALVQAFTCWTGATALLVDLEGHGREEIVEGAELSRTVGWFTTLFPVLLQLEETSLPADALKAVKEQLRGIPNRGIGYDILRYLSKDKNITEKLQAFPQAEVSFNYLGQFDQILSQSAFFELARESSGLCQSQLGSRRYLLEINGLIAGSRLQLDWTYSENKHRRVTIEAVARDFIEALRTLMIHCQSLEAGGYTPSDFSKMRVSQEEIDELISELDA